MTKKLHWTQTPEGRLKMAEMAKNKVKEAKANGHVKRKYTKRKGDTVIIIDSLSALAALMELMTVIKLEKGRK